MEAVDVIAFWFTVFNSWHAGQYGLLFDIV